MNSLSNGKEAAFPVFDYSILSAEEKLATLENEKRLEDIFNRYEPEVGEVFYNQQKVLANHGNGTFQSWYESKGFNRGKVYQYINNYKFLNNIEDLYHRDIFVGAPKSLQKEMSKPSAIPEVNEKVFNGDITTHKEYKEQEELIKQKDLQIKQQSEEIERLKNKPPQVIEKPVPKEVVPHDYGGLKSDNQQLSRALQQAQSELERTRSRNKAIEEERNRLRSQMQDMGEKSAKYDEMNEAMKQMNGQLDAGQQKLKAQKEIYDLVKNAETLIREIAPLTYLINGEEILNNEYARKPVEKIVGDLRDMADRLESSIEKQILEGVIINE